MGVGVVIAKMTESSGSGMFAFKRSGKESVESVRNIS